MENEFNFVCYNCKYYEQQYIKKNSRYMKMGGFCSNEDFNAERKRKPFLLQHACTFWEQKEDNTEERMECIKNALQDMAKRLNDIYNILNDDE